MTTKHRRWRRRLLLATAVGGALWLAASWLVVDQMTRRAHRVRPEPVPTTAWGKIREVRLTTSDSQELGTWFIACRADKPPVLLLHGNGGTRADCLDQAEWLVAAGHPVLLVTLRAHGDSTGERNDFGYSARHDVIAAVGWLEQNCPGRPVVWGRSLGAAAALFAAGELGERVGGYVLECVYRDLRTAVRNRTRLRLFPPLDAIAYAGLSLTAPLVLDDVDRISPLDAATGVPKDVPVLLLAGATDRHAPPAESVAIAERIGPRAEVVVFDGAGHLGLQQADPTRYRELGLRFLASCPAPGR
jgi:pimeloyl-ACP methyl ester carboxylesterase